MKASAAHHKPDFNRLVVWCSDFSAHCFAAWGTGCQGKIFKSSLTCLGIIEDSFSGWPKDMCMTLIQFAFRIFYHPSPLYLSTSRVNGVWHSSCSSGLQRPGKWKEAVKLRNKENMKCAPERGLWNELGERGKGRSDWLKMVLWLCISSSMCHLMTP